MNNEPVTGDLKTESGFDWVFDGSNWLKIMNNKPVAWMSQGGDVSRSKDYFEEMGFKDLIPLYTHPVKELTDEEILNTWKECGESDIAKDMQVNSFLKYFARAILRKAQEK
jgi:hypothetical protein